MTERKIWEFVGNVLTAIAVVILYIYLPLPFYLFFLGLALLVRLGIEGQNRG